MAVSAAAPERASVSSSAEPETLARLWLALKDVEDPEIPVSVVDMGLIVSMAYDAQERAAHVVITYTAMGCPAMEMIQEDIRGRLLREPAVDRVDLDVVWDPAWTRKRLSDEARAAMRELGIAA